MIPIQGLIFLYAGMLLENPEKRTKFMKFINGAGSEVEKIVNGFSGKGGAVKNVPTETAPEEPTEFH